MRKLVVLSVLVASLLPAGAAHAWSAAGHMMMAAMAYGGLSTAERHSVAALLEHHPGYVDWADDYAPEPGIDLTLYCMMMASRWPDDIRHKGGPYDHPGWHYTNYPLKPPGFPMEEREKPDGDVVHGIGDSMDRCLDAGVGDRDRAAALSWVIHLFGDIHAPHHCATLYGPLYPDGNQGGNLSFIRPNTAAVKLHAFWDGLVGSDTKPRTVLKRAIALRADADLAPDELPELASDADAVGISLESRDIAIESVYLKGSLVVSPEPDEAEEPPDGYIGEAKAVARRRAALAGYRLRAWLAEALG